jgi:hypothetical protein
MTVEIHYYSHAKCAVCHSDISNHPISRSDKTAGENQWSHYAGAPSDMHRAVPKEGSVWKSNQKVGI